MKKQETPKIPLDKLNKFIDQNVPTKPASSNVSPDCRFLWESGDIQRFRLNIWVDKSSADRTYREQYIEESFFLHYNKKSGEVINRTIGSNGRVKLYS